MGKLNTRLRSMRKYLKKSQAEFATAGGVSQSTQNRYEQPGTDIPMSYLEKVFETHGTHFNEKWFFHGKGEMLKPRQQEERETPELRFTDLSHAEARIVAEVGQFSEFLKNRPLHPAVKRRLLELLVESIDQALDAPHDDNRPDTD